MGNHKQASAKQAVGHIVKKTTTNRANTVVNLKKSNHSNLLDLSKTSKKTVPKPSRPAQNIHGIRKNQTPQKIQATQTKPRKTMVSPASTTRSQRMSRAKSIKRVDSIKKFNSDFLTKYDSPKAITPFKANIETEMRPHETYRLATNEPSTPSKALEKHPAIEDLAELHRESQKKRPSLKQRLASMFTHPQFATVAAVAACFLLLAGFVTYLNYPRLSIRVATSRAGFDAQLPRYIPAGYGFSSDVTSSNGFISMHFDSRSDETSLALTQRQTNWDSASLLENYVKPRSEKYLTFQQNGLIIYVYNGNNAAWVNSGIFYALEGNSRLSSEQLIKIATSL